MPQMLADQGNETFGTSAEVYRLRGHQHPDAGRNRDHVAAFTTHSTVCNVTASIPAGIRTVAAPITISITGCVGDGSDSGRDRCRDIADGAVRRESGDMITVPAGIRVLVATKPVDFRRGAESLVAL